MRASVSLASIPPVGGERPISLDPEEFAGDCDVDWSQDLRVEPGEYQAVSTFAKLYCDPQFKRWVCLIRWRLIAGDGQSTVGTVPMWLAGLGRGERPRATRRGSYWAAWTLAHGGPPARGDRLSPSVFRRRLALVQVADSQEWRPDRDGKPKLVAAAAPYSKVTRIIEWLTGGHQIMKSPNQGGMGVRP